MADAPLSPVWWVKRLHRALLDRCRTDRTRLSIDDLDAYYRGRPTRLPWLPEQARDEFYRLLELTKSNYMGLVIDATAERLAVEGFRIGDDAEADAETWDIWQNSNFDNDSDQAILEALITGQSYALVAPGPTPDDLPLLFAEHPSQAIVAYAPGSGRRPSSRRRTMPSIAIDGISGPSSPSATRCHERVTLRPASSTPSTSTNMPPRCAPQPT